MKSITKDGEKQIQKAANAARIGFFKWAGQTNTDIWENEVLHTILGHSGGEGTISQKQFSATYLHPDDSEKFEQVFAHAKKPGNSVRTICRIIRKNDGDLRWVEITGENEFTADGRPVCFWGSMQDVTDRIYPKQPPPAKTAPSSDSTFHFSARHLRLLTDSLPVLISYVDNHQIYRFVNRTYTKWFGVANEQIVGYHLRDVLGENAYQSILPKVTKVLSGKTVTYEQMIPYKNAGDRYVLVTYVPDIPFQGEVKGFYSLVQDVSHRKRREANQAFLAEVGETLSRLSTAEEIVQSVGEKMATYLDISTCIFIDIDEEHDRSVVDYLWNRDPTTPEQRGEHQLSKFVGEEFINTARNGATIVVYDTQKDLRTNAKGHATFDIYSFIALSILRGRKWKYLLLFGSNTPRKWRDDEIELVEEKANRLCLRIERARAEEAIRKSNERYQTLFNSIDQGFCICEMLLDERQLPVDYRILEINPAYKKLTGISNVVGKTANELETSLHKNWFEMFANAVNTGLATRFESRLALLGKWFDVYVTPIGQTGGNKFAILFSDITNRKSSEEALREADRRKDEFLATLSHELRNPMTPIKTALELLDSSDDQALDRKAREIMNRQISKMSNLIDDLMDISRITRGKIHLKKKRVLLSEIVDFSIETVESTISQAGHSFRKNVPEEPVHLFGDPDRIHQIITNILANAIKYTDPGGNISLTTSLQGEAVHISVKDTGIGIPEKYLATIFEMFNQVDPEERRMQSGLGIGLSLAKNLAEMHGGTLVARSEGKGKGSEFILSLPVLKKSELPEDADAKKTDARSGAGTSLRLLLVDDNVDIADTLHSGLSLAGHKTKVCYSGTDALTAVGNFHPDGAILDIGLPDMDGYSLARQLRQRFPDILLIALSGWGQEKDKEQSKIAGFNYHLVKPAGIREILKILQKATV